MAMAISSAAVGSTVYIRYSTDRNSLVMPSAIITGWSLGGLDQDVTLRYWRPLPMDDTILCKWERLINITGARVIVLFAGRLLVSGRGESVFKG